LICINHRNPTAALLTSACRSNYNTSNRPKLQYFLLRPNGRRRPDPIPTPILILWSPGSIHSHLAGVWNNLSHHQVLFRKKRAFWNTWHNLCNSLNRIPSIHCLGTPHVHSRNRCRHTCLLHSCYHNYCHSNRSKSIQMASYPKWKARVIRHTDAMITRIRVPIYCWWADRSSIV